MLEDVRGGGSCLPAPSLQHHIYTRPPRCPQKGALASQAMRTVDAVWEGSMAKNPFNSKEGFDHRACSINSEANR